MRYFILIVCVTLCGPALADSFDRPIPQAQTATAELWFLLASLAMIGALYLVHRLVIRK